jgi:hypothetical protein
MSNRVRHDENEVSFRAQLRDLSGFPARPAGGLHYGRNDNARNKTAPKGAVLLIPVKTRMTKLDADEAAARIVVSCTETYSVENQSRQQSQDSTWVILTYLRFLPG